GSRLMHRIVPVDGPLHLRHTLSPLRRGRFDPTTRFEGPVFWRALRTPDGSATTRMTPAPGGITVSAWGPGAGWVLEAAPRLTGAADHDWEVVPHHPIVADLQRRMPGIRFPSWPTVIDILVPTVLEQKVVARTARDAYRRLVLRLGERAPGPAKLWLPPDPQDLAGLPYYEFHPYGVEQRRAGIIRFACSRSRRLEETVGMSGEEARKRLEAIPGIGRWTSAEIARIAWGDGDAVSVNDFHLPHTVSWALAGEARGTDERMLQLLEPYVNKRARVVRLIEAAGIAAPKFGPRQAIQRFSHF
ncbi:MAG TPA: DNA-3-methyladenine glycosylase 2 family protein, partial [Actinomycetota bacterium]|nr:DNA-3-methyladenine glycosylase 2 family protein [Actinomycetota bacterium]